MGNKFHWLLVSHIGYFKLQFRFYDLIMCCELRLKFLTTKISTGATSDNDSLDSDDDFVFEDETIASKLHWYFWCIECQVSKRALVA